MLQNAIFFVTKKQKKAATLINAHARSVPKSSEHTQNKNRQPLIIK